MKMSRERSLLLIVRRREYNEKTVDTCHVGELIHLDRMSI
jgi:hypothetical protein